MSVVQVSRSTHAMGAVIYAAYGRGKDAKERIPRAAAVSYFSTDSATAPETWCHKGLQRVHGAATERKNEAFLITQSFSPEEFSSDNERDVARVHGAGMELAAQMAPNSPYFVATHTDAKGGHVHNHIVVLNHDYATGKGAPKDLKWHSAVRKANDSVMHELGMEVTQQDEVHLTPVEAHALRQGRAIDPVPIDEVNNDNWRHTLRERITELREDPDVETMEDFVQLGLTHNVSIRSRQGRGKNKDKTYLTYALVDDNDKPIKVNNRKCSERASKLGTDFHYEQIHKRLQEKQQELQEAEHAAFVAAQNQERKRIENEEYFSQSNTKAEEDREREERLRRYDRAAAALKEGEAAAADASAEGNRRTKKWARQALRGLEEDSAGQSRGDTELQDPTAGGTGGSRQAVETARNTGPTAEEPGVRAARKGDYSGSNGAQRSDVSPTAGRVEGSGRVLGEEREQRHSTRGEDAGQPGGNAQAPQSAREHQDGHQPQARRDKKNRRTRQRGNEALRRQFFAESRQPDDKDAGDEFEPDF